MSHNLSPCDDVLKHGWGRPDQWVCDGASYFKAEVKAGIAAWAALQRVSAPHHSESHGIIERHNQTYLGILKCFGNTATWREHYAAAFESYNRSPCEALSSKGSKFSPIEVWRPGYKVTPYKIPVLKETEGVHSGYYKEQRDLLEQINLTVKMNNESYLKSMDERKSY